MPLTRDEFQASARRYSRTVAVTALGAFALFDGILFAALYCLGPNIRAIRAWAFAFGPIGEILFALSFMSAGLLIPVALLIAVVRRANRDPNIRCPECGKHLWDRKTVDRLMTVGQSARCEHQLFPEIDKAVSSNKTPDANFAILIFCGFGVLFIATAIAKPAPESYVYWGVALVNFLFAGRAITRRMRRRTGDNNDNNNTA